MGQFKNEAIEQAELEGQLNDIAVEIALQTGLLTQCPIHYIIYDPYKSNYEDAYRRANYLLTQSHPLVSPFKGNRRKLTDRIKLLCDHYLDYCYICQKNSED